MRQAIQTVQNARVGVVQVGQMKCEEMGYGQGRVDLSMLATAHVALFNEIRDAINDGRHEMMPKRVNEWPHAHDIVQWIEADGMDRFGRCSAFGKLREVHAEFMDHANQVLALMRGEGWLAAEHRRKQEFAQTLRRVLGVLTELNEQSRPVLS